MTHADSIKVQPRTIAGKKVKKLRQAGNIIANIISPEKESTPIVIKRSVFNHLLQEGEGGLLYLAVEGEKHPRPVLIDEIQNAPLSGEALHVVFRQVNLKEKIKTDVSIELLGENTVPNAVVLLVKDSIEVEALPTDLPENFQISVENLTEIGQTITTDDLDFDRSKVSITIISDNEDEPAENMVLAILQEVTEEPTESEVIETPTGEGAATESGSESEKPASEPSGEKTQESVE